jgi:Spy/CpxP family protein refolding chaperone
VSKHLCRWSAGLALGAALLVLVPASAALAGDERGKWWMAPSSKAELGLTDEQSRELEAVFQSMLPRMRGEWETLRREEAALSALMLENGNERAIGLAIDRVEAARSAAGKTRTWMLVKMYRVLTPEQRVKVQAMQEQRDRAHRQRMSGSGPPRP